MQKIIQGSSATLIVRLVQSLAGVPGDPIDLTSASEIMCCFRKADGTDLQLKLSTGGIVVLPSALLGKIKIALTAAQTALLEVMDHETLEIALTIAPATDPVKVQIPDAYAVLASRC